jgi:lipopolysaccharide export system protein LptC
MAADAANVMAGGQRYRIRTAEERRRAFVSATRHTKFVNFLRKALPVFALLLLATYFISTRLATNISIGDMNASIQGFEVKDGNLRMVNPKLQGADKKNGKYVIGADYADQDIKNPNLIKLHAIKADLAAVDGGWSRMTAVRGRFDNKTGRLVMQDKIDIATSTGISGVLTHATLDTKNQVIRSHRPVSFVLPNGTIKAHALTVYSAKRTLTFRGKVAVHIVRPQKEAEPVKAAPAAQTAPVPQAAPPPAPRAEEPGEVALPPAPMVEEPGEVALPPLPGENGAGQSGAQGAAPNVP